MSRTGRRVNPGRAGVGSPPRPFTEGVEREGLRGPEQHRTFEPWRERPCSTSTVP